MMPAVLLGAFSGLYISVILPEALIVIMITLILCVLTLETAKKTIDMCKNESLETD